MMADVRDYELWCGRREGGSGFVLYFLCDGGECRGYVRGRRARERFCSRSTGARSSTQLKRNGMEVTYIGSAGTLGALYVGT